MEVETIENTLDAYWERWEDPGDYPCGAGGSPLPSYSYLSEMTGEVVIKITFTSAEMAETYRMHAESGVSEWDSWAQFERDALAVAFEEFYAYEEAFTNELAFEMPEGVTVRNWDFEFNPDTCTVTCIPTKSDEHAPFSRY